MPPAQWTMTRFSNGCATTGFDCFEGSRQAARLFFNYSVVISAPLQGLTQTVTQTRKRLESIRRTQRIARRAESMQKRRKALATNAFRRSSYLHTQEVTGSSPAVSTKKFLISQEIRNFFSLPSGWFCLCCFLPRGQMRSVLRAARAVSRAAPVERPARCGPRRRGGCCKGFCRGSGAESRLPPA